MKDSTSRRRCLVAAQSALNKSPVRQAIAIVMSAIRADKTSWPSKFFQIVHASIIIRKSFLKLEQAGELWHKQKTSLYQLDILVHIVTMPQKDKPQTHAADGAYLSREARTRKENAERGCGQRE